MNLYDAYNDFRSETPMSYNVNGSFGNTLIHELGHILTLNTANQVAETTTSATSSSCTTFYDEAFGCMEADAVFTSSSTAYYQGQELIEPEFVTTYAETNISEDIAETFMYYVAQETVPTTDAFSSGGLFKINFIKNNKWLSPFKSLSNEIHTDLESSEGALTFKTQHRHRHRTHCLPDPKTLKAAGLAWQ